jgi:hypothetical protein
MSRSLLGLLAIVGLASCSDNLSWRNDEYSGYFRQPADAKSAKNLERRKIMHWTTDPRSKRRIGVLERNEITLEGSRQAREHWIIYDQHFREVGFISAEGKFYRFDEHGRRVYVGEYVIGDDPQRRMFMTGLKVFFGLPLTDNLALEDIDPYGDF